MIKPEKPITILMADDDKDDQLLVREALGEVLENHELRCVCDGVELLDYLRGRSPYADEAAAPRPDLILLDLKMPRKDGREVLRDIKQDPDFKQIPIVALTTSTAPDDIHFIYRMGANSYITKPPTFDGLIDVMDVLCKYWFQVVQLPSV